MAFRLFVRRLSTAPPPPPPITATRAAARQPTRFRVSKFALGAALGAGATLIAWSAQRSDSWIHKHLVMRVLAMMDPETAHNIGIKAAAYGLTPEDFSHDDPILHIQVFNRQLSNPIGLAAGFDKQAMAIDGMLKLGFGFIEVGSITPEPQPGNPKPRVFRLKEDGAIINRFGFNSDGVTIVADRLHTYRELNSKKASPRHGLVGVNLGKNKESTNAAADYARGVQEAGPYADFIVINVSSPNTPGLRMLQSRRELESIMDAVIRERDGIPASRLGKPKIPVLVKIAPDMTDEDLQEVARVIGSRHIDGIVVSNTTITRPPSLKSVHAQEAGGLSGKPLTEMSTECVRKMYRLTKGAVPIVAVGGVSSGRDVYNKIRAGASLVELYTALATEGPGCVPRIKQELSQLLREDGFQKLSDAVGIDHKKA